MKLIPQKPDGFLAYSKARRSDGYAYAAYAEQGKGESAAGCALRARGRLRSIMAREGIKVRV